MKNKLNEIRELLIVVDMVNGFIREGALADCGLTQIVPEIVKMVVEYQKRGQGILFVKDEHTDRSAEFKNFPVHCLKGASECELIEELKKYEEDNMSIVKNSTSAIFAHGFLKLIDLMPNLKRVVGCGVEAYICVLNLFIPLKNYFDQNNRYVDVFVVEDAIDTFNTPCHPRDVYLNASKLLMRQSGIKLVKKYKFDREGDL